MGALQYLFVVLVPVFLQPSVAQDLSFLRSVRECLRANSSLVCFKEKAVRLMDAAINNDESVEILDFVDIARDPNFVSNTSGLQNLPRNMQERSETLNDIILRKLDEFFESRTLKFHLARVFGEGRAKKGGGGGGGGGKGKGMMVMIGMAMFGMMAQLMLGKVAMMSGAALMMAKMALLITGMMALKKGGGGGGGGSDSHVVYAGGNEHGGGGGWHRSFDSNSAQELAYKAYNKQNNEV